MDKRGGRPVDKTQVAVVELQSLMKTHTLIDAWRFKNPQSFGFTWSNPSIKIQCRLDYFLVTKHLRAPDRKYRKSHDRSEISDFILFPLNVPFGELFSKITIKSSAALSFF